MRRKLDQLSTEKKELLELTERRKSEIDNLKNNWPRECTEFRGLKRRKSNSEVVIEAAVVEKINKLTETCEEKTRKLQQMENEIKALESRESGYRVALRKMANKEMNDRKEKTKIRTLYGVLSNCFLFSVV